MRLRISAPTTRTLRAWPDWIMPDATCDANTKPLHAAAMQRLPRFRLRRPGGIFEGQIDLGGVGRDIGQHAVGKVGRCEGHGLDGWRRVDSGILPVAPASGGWPHAPWGPLHAAFFV